MGGISYPLLSDFWPHGEVAKMYGVFREEGHSERAIFLIDKEGIIQYIDIHDMDDQPDNRVLFKKLVEIDPENTEQAVAIDEEKPLPEGDVIMYCNSWCLDCKRARAWLAERNIDYIEIDVDEYPAAAKIVRSVADGNLVTPTFDVRGKIIVDFDKEKLKKAFSD